MKDMPRLLETGPPELRELLAAGLEDAPGEHVLPALRSTLAASIIVTGAATAATAVGTTAAAPVASASTSGALAKLTATTVAGATKASVSLIVAKALVSGVVLGSALCGGAMLTSAGRATQHAPAVRSALTVPAGQAAKRWSARRNASELAMKPSVIEEAEAPASAAPSAPAVNAGESPSSLRRARGHGSAISGKHQRSHTAAVAAGKPAEVEPPQAAPAPEPSARIDSPNLLALEIARVDEARALLNSGKPDAALAALKTYDPASPGAVLGREALIIRIEALLARGDRTGARALAAQYLRRYPKDVHAARMQQIASTTDKAP